MATDTKRILSIDLMRGLVMFVLVGFQPILWAMRGEIDAPAFKWLVGVFTHAEWEGLSIWDMVMPAFLFVSGVTIPFSLDKYRQSGDKLALDIRLLRRFCLLWLLGMVIQGELLSFDSLRIRLFTNTLQAIAVGYLATAIMVLNLPRRWILAVCGICLVAYALVMSLGGDFTHAGNVAEAIDSAVLGRFRDGAPDYNNSWILSSLNFVVSVAIGALAGSWLKNRERSARRKTLGLAAFGALALLLGYAWSPWHPIIKRLWTSSMTLVSSGYALLLLSAFHFVVDEKGWTKGMMWLGYYGRNALVAYFLGEFVRFDSVVNSFAYALAPLVGGFYPAVLAFGKSLIIFAVLVLMDRAKVYVRL